MEREKYWDDKKIEYRDKERWACRVGKELIDRKWVEEIEEWINNSCGSELTNKIYSALATNPR